MPLEMRHTAAVAETPQPTSVADAYRENAHRVARWAARLGGPSVDVEDIVQEVFVVVSRRFDGFRGESSFATWLFGITRKVVANHLRRLRVRSADVGPETSTLGLTGSPPDAELERRQAAQVFYTALARLAEKYRTVLVLFEVEGMSVHEISELSGIKLSTVRVQLARARKKFIEHYQEILRQERRAGRSLRLYEDAHDDPQRAFGAGDEKVGT